MLLVNEFELDPTDYIDYQAELDRFKAVNNRHGHPIGDEVLRRVAGVFRGTVRDADHAMRLGGDEFVVILPDAGRYGATDVATRLHHRIETLPLPAGQRITASFGVATTAATGSAEEPYARAERATHQAKKAGGSTTKVGSTITTDGSYTG